MNILGRARRAGDGGVYFRGRVPGVVAALALGLVAIGVGVSLLAATGSRDAPASPESTAGTGTAPDGEHAVTASGTAATGAGRGTQVAAVPPGTTQPRPGRVFKLEEAMRELDLIRPARVWSAADFTLPTPNGGKFRLSEHRGKPVLINFWATWCPPCLEEMPAMERLYRRHRDAGFVMVAISLDADPKKVGPFLDKHGLTFPVAFDPQMDQANAYGVRALPSSFLVDRDGNLSAFALGPRAWDNDASHSLIEALLR